MARKNKLSNETEKEPFPTRLRELLEERNVTQRQLADYLNCTRQSVSLYATGQSTPDIKIFMKIADFFDVSYDYLLGKSVCKKRENINISKELGLSDEAIVSIKRAGFTPSTNLSSSVINEKNLQMDEITYKSKSIIALNAFLESPLFYKIIFGITKIMELSSELKDNHRDNELLREKDIARWETEDLFRKLLIRIFPNAKEEYKESLKKTKEYTNILRSGIDKEGTLFWHINGTNITFFIKDDKEG